jgi:penicillin-binding protein 2
MIQHPEDRRSALTPQLAVRVAVVGSFALAMFAIIFFRLWFLQVLSGTQYAHAANTNRVRKIEIFARRGEVIDRSGNLLVDSRSSIDVQIAPADLPTPAQQSNLAHPPANDIALYGKLAKVLNISMRPAACKVTSYSGGQRVITHYRLASIPCAVAQQQSLLPYANVTVKQDVSSDVHFYLVERQNVFRGVQVQQVYRRSYPFHDLAAQLFGTVGQVTPAEAHPNSIQNGLITKGRYKGLSENALIGQSGLEDAYDKYLRGVEGQQRVQVDALGRFQGNLPPTPAVAGNTLKLTLDARLQKAGEQALAQSVQTNYGSTGGAFVAMNPQDGEIYAMGSYPTFDPNIFTHPITQAEYNAKFGPTAGSPQFNRAIGGAGPDGSTFKPITATAALESGAWSLDQAYDDTGSFTEGALVRHNAGGAAYGVLTLIDAIKVSSDTFFYNLGALTNVDPYKHPGGGALQQWAHAYGIGRRTGIDLPGESSGNLPSPRWRTHINHLESECEKGIGPFKKYGKRSFCGIADGSNRPWSVGDNVNLAVGQGDVQVTPLQLADAYATIANGGTVVRPHIGLEVDSPDGGVLQKIQPAPARHVNINPSYLDAIRTGLREAASAPGGTSADVFGNFPEQVYGKTGTAQYNGKNDYAWYACFVPIWATKTPIVIVVTVEQGGFGAVAAAPVARQMLSQWFFGKKGQYVSGKSTTL